MHLRFSHMTHAASGERSPRQSGVAMLVVLVFTLALTGLAIVSAKLALQGEGMARNQLDNQVARQAAEAALRDGERDLMLPTGAKPGTATCARGIERPVMSLNGLFDKLCTHGQCGYNDEARTKADFASTNASSTQRGEAWWPNAKGGLWNNTVSEKPSTLTRTDDSKCASFTGSVPLGVYTGASPIDGVVQQPEYLIEQLQRGNSYIFRITARGFGYRQGTEVIVQSYFIVPDL